MRKRLKILVVEERISTHEKENTRAREIPFSREVVDCLARLDRTWVTVLASPGDRLKSLDSCKPDVVLMVMDPADLEAGFLQGEQLHACCPAPVIHLFPHASPGLHEVLAKKSITQYLAGPFKDHELSVLLHLTLEKSALETQLQEKEERFRALTDQVSRARKTESLKHLTGEIALHIKDLMQVMQMNLELIKEDLPVDVLAWEFLREADKTAQRTGDLGTLMLTNLGRFRPEMRILNLNRQVETLLARMMPEVPSGLALTFHPASAQALFRGDSAQVEEIMRHLVVNAMEAMGEQEGCISLATGTMHCDGRSFQHPFDEDDLPEGRYAYLEVVDTGCGMNQETLAEVFDPFFTTKYSGRGLGMAAVLGIMRLHRGAITFESRLNHGSRVRALFPLLETPRERAASGQF